MNLIRIVGATLALSCAPFDAIAAESIQSQPEYRLEQWLSWRGFAAKLAEADAAYGCAELKVGPSGEVGLSCQVTTHEERGSGVDRVYRVAIRERVYVVRLGRVAVIFDATVLLLPLDSEQEHTTPIVALNISRDDSSTITLADDRTAVTCASARAALDAQAKEARDASTRRWITFDRELVTRTCREAGKYRWNGTRFVRAPRP